MVGTNGIPLAGLNVLKVYSNVIYKNETYTMNSHLYNFQGIVEKVK